VANEGYRPVLGGLADRYPAESVSWGDTAHKCCLGISRAVPLGQGCAAARAHIDAATARRLCFPANNGMR